MTKLAIIGSGIVGQATGKGFISRGFDVKFLDVNPLLVNKLNNEGFKATSDYDDLSKEKIDVFFVSVCTPTVNRHIDLNYIKAAVRDLGNAVRNYEDYFVVVIRSTVPPKTTRNLFIPILEETSGKKAGIDFGVCMNPEYLREESNVADFANPRIIVFGSLDKKSKLVLEDIYSVFDTPMYFLTLEEAEIQKYIHNLLNACKISYFNEMRNVCEKLEINADKVFNIVAQSAEASWNPKYGIKDKGPFGGSCLPKDTMAFYAWALENLNTNLYHLHSTIFVNELVKEREETEKIILEISGKLDHVLQNGYKFSNLDWVE